MRYSVVTHAHICNRMDHGASACEAAAVPPKLPPDPALGRAIRRLREDRGLTQEELASRAGMTFGTVNRLESAKTAPAWATVMQIIDALDVSLVELGKAIEAARPRR
jgi:DNA-binding XRE family transcriptional regulator